MINTKSPENCTIQSCYDRFTDLTVKGWNELTQNTQHQRVAKKQQFGVKTGDGHYFILVRTRGRHAHHFEYELALAHDECKPTKQRIPAASRIVIRRAGRSYSGEVETRQLNTSLLERFWHILQIRTAPQQTKLEERGSLKIIQNLTDQLSRDVVVAPLEPQDWN